jgi:hypothetical protein
MALLGRTHVAAHEHATHATGSARGRALARRARIARDSGGCCVGQGGAGLRRRPPARRSSSADDDDLVVVMAGTGDGRGGSAMGGARG